MPDDDSDASWRDDTRGDTCGTRVTAQSLDDPDDTESQDIKDNYCLTTDGDCFVSGVQVYPKSGTHVITVKNVGGKRR
jgi:hypothetical protein